MRRFFAENICADNGTVVLSGDEARHISNVLRMKAGDEALLINGEGTQYRSVLESIADGEVRLRIIEAEACAAEPETHVTLFQCLPKQGKMEVIIQKCVELGIWEIVPVSSKRCVVKLEGKDQKLIRWNKVSAEAAKQCGRAYVPRITPPIKLDDIDLSGFDLVLVPYENEGDVSLKQVLRESIESGKNFSRVALIIGPEGGFEPSEVERAIGKGGIAVSLGKRILRTETAGMAALAQIMYELDQ